MNKFDINFFQKYIPEWQKLLSVIHIHPLKILNSIIVKLWLFVILPSFFFYYSKNIQSIIPFYFLEWFLIIVFIKIIYDIFDWYNDVWIITNEWVISLQWSLLKINTDSVTFDNIEWVWVEQDWFLDKVLKKWDLIIHKIWDDSFTINDAANPFKAVDILETISQESEKDWMENEKFDMIMDALWWVVWDYLENNKNDTEDKIENVEKILQKIEKNEWTIDLR